MRDIYRIANALERIADALADKAEQKPTLTLVETPPEPETFEKPTLEELQNSVRSGLIRVHGRGEDHAALTTKLIGLPLKANEMDEAQCIVMLEDESIQ
jgi:hypothetical protein